MICTLNKTAPIGSRLQSLLAYRAQWVHFLWRIVLYKIMHFYYYYYHHDECSFLERLILCHVFTLLRVLNVVDGDTLVTSAAHTRLPEGVLRPCLSCIRSMEILTYHVIFTKLRTSAFIQWLQLKMINTFEDHHFQLSRSFTIATKEHVTANNAGLID